jgi:hypothetical protein
MLQAMYVKKVPLSIKMMRISYVEVETRVLNQTDERGISKLEVTICDLKLGWFQICSNGFTEQGVAKI